MTEDTKKLFNAPWRTTTLDYVEDADDYYVCECQTSEMANRLSRLPELYDALKKAVYANCEDCLCALDEFNNGEYECDENGCVKYDLIEKGCIFKKRDCCSENRSWIELLRKVRDGK